MFNGYVSGDHEGHLTQSMFNLFNKKNEKNKVATKKVVFKLDGMHCVSCSMNIDGELEEMSGVINASTSYAKSSCAIEFDPTKVKERDLTQTIKKLGYEATVQL